MAQPFEVLNPGGHERIIDGLKQYVRKPGGVGTAQLANASVTDDKLDPDGVLSEVDQLKEDLENVSIEVDDLGLDYDEDEKMLYVTYRDVRSANGIPATFGDGGGGSAVSAKLTVDNTTGWNATSVSAGAACVISLNWSSVEDGLPTGAGTLTVSVDGAVKSIRSIEQGAVSVDVGPYLTMGTRKVRVRVSDVYDQSKTKVFTVNVVDLSVSSSFDTSGTFAAGSEVEYTYTPMGAVEKTVHFEVDGTELATEVVTASGRQQTKALPAMTHGAHLLRVWFTATINGSEVTSNVLTHSLVVVNPQSNVPIISSAYTATTASQYETLAIPYIVYTPNSLTSQVTLSANGQQVSSLTVDRTEQVWSYRCDAVGPLTLSIASGGVTKELALTVSESDIDIEPETADLALHLTSYGRSNNEAHPEVWQDSERGIAATLTGFNWVTNGWVADEDGDVALRVNGGARVTIPYLMFAQDFRGTGKTIDFEFATGDVLDYDAVVVSCMSGGRGFQLTAQRASIASEQTSISTQYKEDERVSVAFVIEKRTEDRLIYCYINGIMSGVVQYPDNDDFSQQNPVGITIGADGITTDIYHVRVYDNDLTRYQILDNWVADTTDVALMLERYSHNDVYDEYGQVVIDKLPTDLPYFIIEAPQLPQYKGDKKTISGSYTDPQDASRSFTFTGCQINVQGTSSAPYARKNYDMQFKGGFELARGHADTYQLAPTVKPFNRFVLKADVASSESANNVELVKLFCDTDPYKRPEELADPLVRKGIYGFPIVVFWRDTNSNATTLLGKYNFNFPKRAPGPYGYSGDMESWEFENNTSNLMLFKSDYFSQAPLTDPDTGETKATWRYDYEARFPSDEWVDIDKLQEFQTFVYSTYRAEATGKALPSPVTYSETHVVVDEVTDPETGAVSYVERVVTEDVTYTTDTAAYRLSRFKHEFPKYAEVDSFIFYYIFTELFLMVDSRAKNLFIGFSGGEATGLTHIDRKAVAEPYDMDTAIGTNNEGSLVFGYSLEDTDRVNNADVFNGQTSVLWNNVRDAFSAEIATMYQTLRSAGTLSYETVERRFEEHQSKWPEAIFNEDAQFKYLDPLVNPDAGKEPTDVYLPMLQGSKEEQRKWWLYNRFRYMDSRWLAGDARSDVIQLRGYAKADITVTPYADIYPTVRYGSYTVSQRGTHGVPATLACPLDNVNDTEIYIYSAPQLASVGDLSPLKVGFADFSKATKLQSIKVGSSASGYENQNLTGLSVGTNPLLSTVDARNCTALAGTVDLSGARNVEHVYLAGTKVTSVSLPVGGVLKTLQLPATVTNLTVQNQPSLTTFSMPSYANITTLRVENSTGIPMLQILDDMPANSRVRLIGFTMAVTSEAEVESFFDFLDTMRGLDEAGNNVDKAVVSGTVTGLGTITGAWLAEMNSRYPDVTIQYQHISSTLTYYSYDGGTVLHTETVNDGGDGTWDGTPSRTSTVQYDYTFLGWSRYEDQSTADPTATKGVGADRSVYAAYSYTTRTYTVTWKNANGTVLETDQNVPYGTMPTYDGATPTQDGQSSTGWQPTVAAVTGDATYTAVYIPLYQVRFYNGSTLLQTIRVQEGSNAVYTGATPTSSEGEYMEFTGWDKSLENIRAATDFYAQYRDSRSVVIQYVEGTMKDYFSDTATTIADGAFYDHEELETVKTSATTIGADAFRSVFNLTTIDLTGAGAVSFGNNAFDADSKLTALVIRSSSMASGSGSAPLSGTAIAKGSGAIFVPDTLVDTYKADSIWGQYPILPLSEYPTTDYSTIRDSWATIISKAQGGTAASSYAVGDTKLLDLGTEGKVYAQVAKVDASGITFVTKDMLETTKAMNSSYPSGESTWTGGGWEKCEMRTYLNSTVLALFPAELQAAIKTETKYSDTYESALVHDGCVTQDKLWLLSAQEVFGGTSYETQGEHYSGLFSSDASRIKYNQSGSANSWWMRSASSASLFRFVYNSGSAGTNAASTTRGVVFGFCL